VKVPQGHARMKHKVTPPAPTIVPRLLTVPQAAHYLNVGPWAIRSLHWEGTVRGIRIGRRLLFDRAVLDAYVDRLLKEANSACPKLALEKSDKHRRSRRALI
jgi:excisionase family DNA binding protein